jgi:O-methyltransferase involved in polyketide biosynthesis
LPHRHAVSGMMGKAAPNGRNVVEPFDPSRPNIARVWDYWLGGKDNFAADRELAERMLAVHPVSAQMARENRQFLGRAVGYVAAQGIRQFIDVGAGLPTAVNTHDIAKRVDASARVAYVDNDPVVISHARSLVAESDGVIAVPGDMHRPEDILADGALNELIDLAKPVCVIMSAVLHFADADTARKVAGVFTQAIVPGSYVIISVGSGNRSEEQNFTTAYTAAQLYIHSAADVRTFFDGLELVPPGVTAVREWYVDEPVPQVAARSATFICGAGRKTAG